MNENRRSETPGGFSALPAGTVLDRYRIDSVIAAGGFGITYLCHHVTLGKPYALKEHFPRQFAYRDGATMNVRPTDPETFSWTLERFLQEGRALASCDHPNVVDVADVFEANQTAYMVLGYEEGRSLKTWLEMLGRAPTQAEIDAILPPLLDALAYVHAQGLLHRRWRLPPRGFRRRRLRRTWMSRDLGVYAAPFVVLREATLPAVLLEVGIIVNRNEEKQLEDADHRGRIQTAVLDALSSLCRAR